MPVPATCPHCQSTYNLRDELRGKTVRCRSCSGTFVVGAFKAKPAAEPASSARVAAAPRRRPADDDYEDDDYDRPRKKSRALLFVLLGVGGGVFLLLITCAGVGYWALSQTGDDEVVVGGGGGGGGGVSVPAPASVPQAVAALKDANGARRMAALTWLAQVTPDEQQRADVVGALEPLATGADGAFSDQAARALAHWASAQEVPTLLRMVNSQSAGVRQASLEALGRLKDERAVVPVAGRLPDFFDRAAAGRALEAIGPAAEKEVVKYAFHHDASCAQEARRLLRVYGTKDSDLLPQAILALRSTQSGSRHSAADWLLVAPVDPQRSAEVAQALEPVLTDSDVFAREPAGKALCRWATRESVPSLIKCLDSDSGEVRKQAADALGKLKDERAAAPLARQLTRPFEAAQYGRALEALGPALAEKEAARYLFDKNRDAQEEARRLIRVFGTKSDVIAGEALAALKDAGGDTARQVAVCTWLAQAQADDKHLAEVSQALDPLVKAPGREVREAAAKALAVWGTKDNVESLVALLDNTDLGLNGARAAAMQALGKIKDERGALPVAVHLTNFFDREAAASALEAMGPVAEKAVLPFVNHNDAGVRLLACRVLKTVGGKDSVKMLEAHAMRDLNPDVKLAAAVALQAIKGRQ